MMEIIRELISLAGKDLFRVWFASVVIYLLPDSVFARLGILEFWKQYKPVITVAAMITTLFMIASLLFEGAAWSMKMLGSRGERREERARRERRAKRTHDLTELAKRQKIEGLSALTPIQQTYLKSYLDQNTRTAEFRISDGNVVELERRGILSRARPDLQSL